MNVLNYWLLIILQWSILQSNVCHSNTPFFIQNKSFDIASYGKVINRAELLITSEKFAAAGIIYDSLFNLHKLRFAKNYFNAALCYAILENESQSLKYVNALVNKGITVDWLKKYPALSACISSESWQILEKEEKLYYTQKNTLRDSLLFLFNMDQNVRKKPDYWNTIRKQVEQTDLQNINTLNKIIKDYNGLPGEDLVGIIDNSLSNPPYYMVIWHQTTAEKLYDFSGLLLNEIKKGTIEPHIGARYYHNCSGDGTYFGMPGISKGIYAKGITDGTGRVPREMRDSLESQNPWCAPINLIVEMQDFNLQQMNSNRIAYGLENFEDYYKKVLYSHKNPASDFTFFNAEASTFYYKDAESYEGFKRSFIPLDSIK
jgi:hypothetical protein